MADLTGMTAIISGGVGDIGIAIARAVGNAGAAVAIGDVHEQIDAAEALERVTQEGVRVRYDRVDVTQPDAVSDWVAAVKADLGVPQLVIPNAAIVNAIDILDITPDAWQREVAVNLHGAFYLAQTCAKQLIAANLPGRMVFVGSWAAHSAHANLPAYCATKAALRMLCQTFALRLAQHDILVNEIAPGFVDGGLSARLYRENPELRTQTREWVPIRKLITTREVAQQVVQLCDLSNQHITGSTLVMDGGLSLTRVSNFLDAEGT